MIVLLAIVVVLALLIGLLITIRKARENIAAQNKAEQDKIVEFEQKLKAARAEQEKAREEASREDWKVGSVEGWKSGRVKNEKVGGEEEKWVPRKRDVIGAAFAEANMAYDAFGRMCIIEAYFHGKLAQMKGHRQMGNFLSQVRVAWRQSGYRNEKDLVHPEFGPLESSIGRAMIRIESKHEAEMGFAALRELAEAENEIAQDYLAGR